MGGPLEVHSCHLAWELVSRLPSRVISPYLFPSRRLDRSVPGLQDLKDRIAEAAAIGTWCIHRSLRPSRMGSGKVPARR